MVETLVSLGIPANDFHSVPGVTPGEAKQLMQSDKFVLHPQIRFDYQEDARLLSHLYAIRAAYRDGHDRVLILENDAVLSAAFLRELNRYIDGGAPADWNVLQFATTNPNVIRQGLLLREPFVSWQPYHRSMRAYAIHRRGMSALLERVHGTEPGTRESIWRLPQFPRIVASEVVCSVAGGAYTSTGLWIDAYADAEKSAVQSNASNVDDDLRIVRSYGSAADMQQQIAMKKMTSSSHGIIDAVRNRCSS